MAIIRYSYFAYFFVLRKNQIVRTGAQIAAYKLKLKSRLNQKLNSGQVFGTSDLKTILNKIMDSMRELDFSSASDYQKLINLIIDMNAARDEHNLLNRKKSEPSEKEVDISVAPEFDQFKEKYTKVFNFDPDIVICIIELAKLTQELHKQVNEYNKFAMTEKRVQKIKDLPETFQIEHFYILEDIYSKWKLSKETDQTKSKNAPDNNSNPVAIQDNLQKPKPLGSAKYADKPKKGA